MASDFAVSYDSVADKVTLGGAVYTRPVVTPPPPPPPVDSLRTLLRSDMELAMEALPDGFEKGSWAQHETVRAFDFAHFPRLQPWYVVYEESGGNPAPACGVLLQDAQAWAQFADGWKRVIYDADGVGGADLFPENWINANGTVTPGGGSKPAVTTQQDGGTVIRLGAGSPNDPRYLFHLWDDAYDARLGAPTAFVTAVRARLDPKAYDPRARYVMAAACDHKGPNWENGWQQMTGRFKRVDANWRLWTSSCGTLQSAPPLVIDPAELR